jgi:hypothetical protein
MSFVIIILHSLTNPVPPDSEIISQCLACPEFPKAFQNPDPGVTTIFSAIDLTNST